MKTLRVILSLPGDVGLEKEAAARVLERIKLRVAPVAELHTLLWEHDLRDQDAGTYASPGLNSHRYAGLSLSGAEPAFLPAQADIVLCVLWGRMGARPLFTPARPDGKPYASGTEYLFEESLRAIRPANVEGGAHAGPHLAVYIRDAAPILPLKPRVERERVAGHADYVDHVLAAWTSTPAHSEGPYFLRFRHLDELLGDLEDRLWNAIIARVPGAEAIRQTPPVPWRFPEQHGSPFRGLLPFEAEHADIYFGRARAIDEAVTALKRQAMEGRAFLLLFGAGGAGKSSLLRAGLVPWLTKPGVVEGIGLWRRAIVRPGDSEGDLFEGLATALLAPDSLPELVQDANVVRRLAELLRTRPDGVGAVIQHGLGVAAKDYAATHGLAQPPEARLVLALDHLEELFGADQDIRGQRTGYIAAISALARCGRVYVAATLRSAYFVQCEEVPELMELKSGAGQYQVPAFTAEDLSAVVRRPAEAAGLTFEASRQGGGGLDEVLIADTQSFGRSGVLPLLQFNLNEIFKARATGGLLTFAAYEALGGIENGLARGADALVASLPSGPGQGQAAFDEVFRSFSAPGVDVQDDFLPLWVSYADLVSAPPGAKAMVDAFLRAGLLTARDNRKGGSHVSLAHPALAYHWPRLRDMLLQQRAFGALRAKADIAAQTWLDNRRRAEWLWPVGKNLLDAEELLAQDRASLPRDTVRFIEASMRARRAEEQSWSRRLQVMAFLLFAAVLGVGYVGFLTFKSYRQYKEDSRVAGDAKKLESQRTEAARRERDATSRTLAQADYLQADRWAEEGRQNWMLASLARALRVDPKHSYASTRVFYTLAMRKVPLVWYRHRGALTVAAFSPNGLRVLTASADHTAVVRDTASGQRVFGQKAQILGAVHKDIIYTASFSPGGRYVLTGSADTTARIFDVDTGDQTVQPMNHKGAVNAAAFSPDGTIVATASEDRFMRLWSAADGSRIQEPVRHESAVKDLAWSPDGTKVATATIGGIARMWSTKTLQQIGAPMRHERSIRSITFSPDGTRILTASDDGMAIIWDANTGEPVNFPFTHTAPVLRATFSPSGKRVATVSMDKTARVWDAATGRPICPPLRHPGPVRWASFSPDGMRLVTACEDLTGGAGEERGFARVWDIRNGGRPLSAPLRHERPVISASFSPDGEKILTASRDFTARLWDANTGAVSPPIMRTEKPAILAKWGPPTYLNKELLILAAGEDGMARLWKSPNNVPVGQPMVHASSVTCANFSADATRVVTGTENGIGRIWMVGSNQMLLDSIRHGGAITSINYTPDGKYVATSSKDGSAVIWDAATGRAVSTPLQHGGAVTSSAISPNGLWLATSCEDKIVRLFKIPGGSSIGEFKRHSRTVNSVAWSADSKRLVSCSEDGTAVVWNVADGLPAFSAPLRHESAVMSAAFSPDGLKIATASADGTARIWYAVATDKASGGTPIGGRLDHADLVWGLDWSADSQRLATCSWDGQARVWDANTGVPLSDTLPHEGPVWSAVFSPDGGSLLTASSYGARVWELPVPGETAAPEWFSDFVESLGGAKMGESGLPVPFDQQAQFQKIREEVMKAPANDPFSLVAKQFFTRAQRADSLGSRSGTPGIGTLSGSDSVISSRPAGALPTDLKIAPGTSPDATGEATPAPAPGAPGSSTAPAPTAADAADPDHNSDAQPKRNKQTDLAPADGPGTLTPAPSSGALDPAPMSPAPTPSADPGAGAGTEAAPPGSAAPPTP